MACRAAQTFRGNFERYPGQTAEGTYPDEVNAEDVALVKGYMEAEVKKAGPEAPVDVSKYAHEMVRFSDSKLHNISAVLGGIAS